VIYKYIKTLKERTRYFVRDWGIKNSPAKPKITSSVLQANAIFTKMGDTEVFLLMLFLKMAFDRFEAGISA